MDELHRNGRFERNFRAFIIDRGAIRESKAGDFFAKEFRDTVDVFVVYNLHGENRGCAQGGIFALHVKVLPIARTDFAFKDALFVVWY